MNMELETLKRSWENLDKNFRKAASFNQTLVEHIISSRVTTTMDRIKNVTNFFYIVLSIETVFLIAILVGNPFDFSFKIQFIPYLLLLSGVILAFINLFRISRSIGKLSPAIQIGQYLKGIVSIYDRNKRFERWFGFSFLCVGLLVPFSFLPPKIERMGLLGALADIGIMISITTIIYFAAFKFGAFKNRNKERLEASLAELNELKALANEMN
jgi:hypothetical protein